MGASMNVDSGSPPAERAASSTMVGRAPEAMGSDDRGVRLSQYSSLDPTGGVPDTAPKPRYAKGFLSAPMDFVAVAKGGESLGRHGRGPIGGGGGLAEAHGRRLQQIFGVELTSVGERAEQRIAGDGPDDLSQQSAVRRSRRAGPSENPVGACEWEWWGRDS